VQGRRFIGLDVHKATIPVAVAQGECGGEVRHRGSVPHRPDHVRTLVETLVAGGACLHLCCEAGPCGYALHRQLVGMGHGCIVVAPSLIPVKAGDRVKTDRRDAVMLAKLHRAGELTAAWVPDAAHQAMRDLVRAGATAMRVTGKARPHLQGFLLRHGPCQDAQDGSVSRFSVRQPMRPTLFQHPAWPRSLCRVLGLTLGLQPGVEAFFGDLQDEHAKPGKSQENNGRPEFIRRHGAAFRILPRTYREMV